MEGCCRTEQNKKGAMGTVGQGELGDEGGMRMKWSSGVGGRLGLPFIIKALLRLAM